MKTKDIFRVSSVFGYVILMLLLSNRVGAQIDVLDPETVSIFHAMPSVIQYDEKSRAKKIKIIAPEGSTIHIQIQNTNPWLYQYGTSLKEVELKDDMPNISELLLALNEINFQLPIAAFQRAGVLYPAVYTQNLNPYLNAIQELKVDIETVKKIIEESDDTKENIPFYIRKIKAEVSSNKNRFLDDELKKHLDETLKSNFKPTGPEQEIVLDAFLAQAKYYSDVVSDIRKILDRKHSFSVEYKISRKTMVIAVIASPLKGVKAERDVDTIATIIIRPYITSSWELLPTANFVYTESGKKYGVEDGKITQRPGESVTPKLGMFLVRNIWNWGASKEIRTGIGVGFALKPTKDQKILDNLYAGYFVNMYDQLRLGFGVGWAQVPSGLNTGVVGEALPKDVSNIDDITSFSRKPAAFLSITLFGFEFGKK